MVMPREEGQEEKNPKALAREFFKSSDFSSLSERLEKYKDMDPDEIKDILSNMQLENPLNDEKRVDAKLKELLGEKIEVKEIKTSNIDRCEDTLKNYYPELVSRESKLSKFFEEAKTIRINYKNTILEIRELREKIKDVQQGKGAIASLSGLKGRIVQLNEILNEAEKALEINKPMTINAINNANEAAREKINIYTHSTSRCEHWRMQNLKIVSNSLA